MTAPHRMIITIQCKDRVGLVAQIAQVLAARNVNIVSMREYVDTVNNNFFARLEVNHSEQNIALYDVLQQILPTEAIIKINSEIQKNIVVLVSKEYHCLSDILVRNHFKTLGAQVQCVIGNHAVLQEICTKFEIPYHFIDHNGIDKQNFEAQILSVINTYNFDFIVLAKFMRILSPSFIAGFTHKIVNIHHSFLPAFIGASPYRQAHQRGVKLIGATAHFVTNDLDEGPIIAQQTMPVNHTYQPADMVRTGKEIETAVLIKALQSLFSDRVFVYDNKTIVFD
ncbi:MAG: formyltetrahydrofolate deformylase [Sphingobacteriales bacterium]|nr:MAG: formyltetrahydrofolate deformylase [Sphingobacteriales bacterium]